MKKLLLLIAASLFMLPLCYAQEIEKNEVDEFTGNRVITTSWEKLTYKMSFVSYARFKVIDDDIYLNVKMMQGNGSVFAIAEEAKLMLMFEDKSVLELQSLTYEIASRGAGAIGLAGSNAHGINATYVTGQDDWLSVLQKELITKVRIYTTDGYIDTDVRNKDAIKIRAAANLIDL